MKIKSTVTALLVAVGVAVTSSSAAAPVAGRQRISIVVAGSGHTFVLTPLTPGPLGRDTGNESGCCWKQRFVVRDGQRVEINDPLVSLTGKKGTLVLRIRIEWVDAGHDYSVGTGTWRVVRGTGAYAGLTGTGRSALSWPPGGFATARHDGIVQRAARSMQGAGRAGGRIAFVRSSSDYRTWHLFVMRPDGGDVLRLTDGEVADQYPKWSPDGTRILFQRWTTWRDSDIYTINANGTGLRRLTDSPQWETEPAWSPDGKLIAYVSRRHGSDAGQLSERGGLYVMRADGSGKHRVDSLPAYNSPGSPAWSPDGRRIAFTGGGAVFVVDRDGTGQRRLTDGGSYFFLQWSPDGSRIAFVQMPFRYNQIYVVDASGGPERLVTRHAYTESGVAWRPDGRGIVYARERHGGVWTIDVDRTHDRRLATSAPTADLTAGGFTWSPDGRAIAFASDAAGTGDIYVMNRDGSGRRRVTSTPEIDGAPAWSP